MKRLCLLYLLLLPLVAGMDEQTAPGEEKNVRFFPLHIYIDSGESELAAYQFELKVTSGDAKIVGVEGGEHPAFKEAPYYDAKALSENRIIIAAFSTDSVLPHGRTRVATLHMQAAGDSIPEYELVLTVSADAQSNAVAATITYEQGESQ